MRNQSAIWYTRQENRDRFCAHREEMDEQGYSSCWIILSLSVIQQGRRQKKSTWHSFDCQVLRLKRECTKDGKRKKREYRWKWGRNEPVMARERIPVSSGDLWRRNSRFARLPSFPLHSCHFFHREACQNMMKDWREWLWHDIRHRQLETHSAVTRTHCLLG